MPSNIYSVEKSSKELVLLINFYLNQQTYIFE